MGIIQNPSGSWGGLPDFGITEGIQSFLNPGSALTPQGGSSLSSINYANPSGSNTAGYVSPAPVKSSGGTVVGPISTPYNQENFNSPPPASNTGGGGGQPTGNPTPPQPSPNDLEMQQVDSAYGSAMDYLNRAEQAIKGYQPQVEAGINSTYDTNKQVADTGLAQGNRQIDTATTDTQSRLTNAISAARQALQESLMGGKQRFGSGSNVYKALGEYGTTKFQQASGQARDTAEQTYRSLQEQTQTLNENYSNAVSQLNTWKQTQMQSAQQEFMNKLMEIDSNRNEASQNRSFQKIQLLQDMRSRADAIANQAWTFQQNLDLQRAAYGQQLQSTIASNNAGTTSGVNTAATNGANGINSINMSPISASSSSNPQDPYANMTGKVNWTGKLLDPSTGLPY